MSHTEAPRVYDQVAEELLFPNGVFSLCMFAELTSGEVTPVQNMPRNEIILNDYIRMIVLDANASQVSFELTSNQKKQLGILMSDQALRESIAHKMNDNSETIAVNDPAFDNLHRERPRSAFFYLIKDQSQREVLVILEGLVRSDGTAKLHDDLRILGTNQRLMRQIVAANQTQVVRSGHIWGNIVYTDCSVSPDGIVQKISDGWMDKLERILLREGYIILGPDGVLAKQQMLAKMISATEAVSQV